MPKIKTKEVLQGTIKVIDKMAIATERTKDSIVSLKEKAENTNNSDNNRNMEDKTKTVYKRGTLKVIDRANRIGRNSTHETKKNVLKLANKTKDIVNNGYFNTDIKTTLNNVKKKFKKSKKNIRRTNETTKKTCYGVKKAIQLTTKSIKMILDGLKSLIALIIAGGWIAIVIIIVVCMIAVLFNSFFGIFFSNDNSINQIPMKSVIADINKEMNDKIQYEKDHNTYDDYRIISDRSEWKEILSLYSIKISNNNELVITVDDEKAKVLKDIFWDVHSISVETKNETYTNIETNQEESGTILYINIKSKTVEQMIEQYNFDSKQQGQLQMLLSKEYDSMWASVIYGNSIGNTSIVDVALTQVGNVGGYPYWSWYGYNSRIEWCAAFISWVANELGYIENGIMPKFASCQKGIDWFKAMDQWQKKDYIPKAGDIIFFDWESDGNVDHVGLVEKVENGIIYTIEGNSTADTCRQKEYQINSNIILGYGVLNF